MNFIYYTTLDCFTNHYQQSVGTRSGYCIPNDDMFMITEDFVQRNPDDNTYKVLISRIDFSDFRCVKPMGNVDFSPYLPFNQCIPTPEGSIQILSPTNDIPTTFPINGVLRVLYASKTTCLKSKPQHRVAYSLMTQSEVTTCQHPIPEEAQLNVEIDKSQSSFRTTCASGIQTFEIFANLQCAGNPIHLVEDAEFCGDELSRHVCTSNWSTSYVALDP